MRDVVGCLFIANIRYWENVILIRLMQIK